MSDFATRTDRLLDLAETALDGSFSDSDLVELNSLLLVDEAARRRYLKYCLMNVVLRVELRASRAVQKAHEQINTNATGVTANALDPVGAETRSRLPVGLLHGTLSYFSEGLPLAYLIATVIVGVGLLVGSRIYVSSPGQLASESLPATQDEARHDPQMPFVGRITGMVDCQWVRSPESRVQSPALGSRLSTLVALGDKFALSSGLMEITYDTGAKVILKGPCTYEVESATGGFLSIGQLTAKVEKKAEGGGRKADSPLSTLHSPLFAVRTPTATVTDLGTEFAINVDKSGGTTSHVFRGSVIVHPISEPAAGDIILRENESARAERVGENSPHVAVRRVASKSDDFARSITSPLPMHVLAWFRMGEDEPDAVADKAVGPQIRDHKNYVHLDRRGSPRYSADTAASGSSLAMSFDGGVDAECFGSARFPHVVTDYFILEAWVRMRKTADHVQLVVHNGETDVNGYALGAINGTWQGVFERVGVCDSGVACELGKWTHLALVCERGRAQLWVDGRAVGKAIDAIPNVPDGPFGIGGLCKQGWCAFNGEIDEVRLSTFLAPFQPAMLLLRKGKQPQ